ncbi:MULTISPECIES: DUF3861 domain-containing protein [Acinetobacter]|uniref:DUF3861 domain-containing protein n=1 Tax=Acinetobacter TaxID=469 RepID=UPI00141BE26B|nr:MULTISPECIES: DUF3861 domain-containing protein [Acinetobacter]MCS4298858.1 hypothetical protein [Acinetobacter guillouiae]MCW2252404.1 hypothetical protein [Acinetobacter sp. BIGb0204]NII38009.1 hypothetical protein [Acinetobacter sp. BIGb0196]
MKQHQYYVTVQHLADAQGHPSTYNENIEFNVGNHDDIFQIVERLKAAEFFDEETTKAFAVGLKLFLEVMITHRDHALFQDFEPAVKQFMKNLKQNVKKNA